MLDFSIQRNEQGAVELVTSVRGKALLTIPQLNKGTAFSHEERDAFGLTGKLPCGVETIDQQVERAYRQLISFDEHFSRNIYLNGLINTNQVLFYRLVETHLAEILPIIYTPIVGAAVQHFNQTFRQTRGLYISYQDIDRMDEILGNRSNPDVQLLVVSDGGAVLGIGDQGVSAMMIPVAKLMVYTAVGGIDPNKTLPIMLDAGTDNEALLNDPMYLGWAHPRIVGKDYTRFIETFIACVKRHFSRALLHWEDFGTHNAYYNLALSSPQMCSFNDDIQGTGVVTTAAVLAAIKKSGQSLKDQRIVIFGAGAAGVGIANSIKFTLMKAGLCERDALACFYLVGRPGLLSAYVTKMTETQRQYMRSCADADALGARDPSEIGLLELVQCLKPTVLIGSSGVAGAFNQAVVEAMQEGVERPIIFPLSNPTHLSEAQPKDLMAWTQGRALVATGSPFDPVLYKGRSYPISQCNNYLAFPGIGLGVMAVQATQLAEEMLWSASQALCAYPSRDKQQLLPDIEEASEAAIAVAIAVATEALKLGVVRDPSLQVHEIEEKVRACLWRPEYHAYRYKAADKEAVLP